MGGINMKKLATLSLTLLMTNTLLAKPMDVFGKGDRFIKITRDSEKKQVGFQLCLKTNTAICQKIGKKNFYAIDDLIALRNSEKWDVVKAAGSDVAVIIVGAFAGFALGFSAAGGAGVAATSTAGLYTIPGGILLGIAGGITLSAAIDAINPYEQYKQLETLEDEVLNDTDIFTETDSTKFANRLEAVLDNL